jgi:hypothetical protein
MRLKHHNLPEENISLLHLPPLSMAAIRIRNVLFKLSRRHSESLFGCLCESSGSDAYLHLAIHGIGHDNADEAFSYLISFCPHQRPNTDYCRYYLVLFVATCSCISRAASRDHARFGPESRSPSIISTLIQICAAILPPACDNVNMFTPVHTVKVFNLAVL